MGAFADYIEAIKATVNGPILYGGTIFPTSDDFPSIPAFVIKGATFPLPSLEVLADIPYQNLMLDMEVRVMEHERPDTSIHPSTKYILKALPPVNTRISDVVNYNILDYWEPVINEGGDPGADGADGWTPVYGIEASGQEYAYFKIIDYIGGSGVKPELPDVNSRYLGLNGYTSKNFAVNVKGPRGLPGDSTNVRPMSVYISGGFKFSLAPLETSETMLQRVNVKNEWSQARDYLIKGSCSFRETGDGTVTPRVRLRTSGGTQLTTTSSTLIDSNAQRIDIGNDPGGEQYENHKINVEAIVRIPAGATINFGLSTYRLGSQNGRRTWGILWAIGL